MDHEQTIRSRLCKCQLKFKAIKKNKRVSFNQTNYKYAPIDYVMGIIKPILLKERLYVEMPLRDDKLMIIIRDIESGKFLKIGSMIWKEFIGENSHKNFQDFGKYYTYAARYLLVYSLGLVCVGDDTDGLTIDQLNSSCKETKEDIVNKIYNLSKSGKIDDKYREDLMNRINNIKNKNLSDEQLQNISKWVDNKKLQLNDRLSL